MQDLKSQANRYYADALLAMEQSKGPATVRGLLIKAVESLNLLANSDSSIKEKANGKASMLLSLCKEIRLTSSYVRAYKALTGKDLPAEEANKQAQKDVVETKPQETPEVKPIEQEEAVPSKFDWNSIPSVSFDDVAGLDDVKDEVYKKVIQPLIRPDLYEGYDKKNGGGLLLYGPPGTGKTMIAAAIAKEIGAKFCCVGASDLLTTGVGNTEKLISQLFKEARAYRCAVIFFDEVDSLCPASTRAQAARQVRSELLRQMQGLSSYGEEMSNILYLVAATNKPWDIDPAFVRPGRFGTRVYVGLPDKKARLYMVRTKLEKIKNSGKVAISKDIDFDEIVDRTNGFNGADVSYLLDEVQESSISRASLGGEKIIIMDDFLKALERIKSSVQENDLKRLEDWKLKND